MKKTLIAGGCSFTGESWNWPGPVSKEKGLELVNVGLGSIGNDLISRRVIHAVSEQLLTKTPEELLVGVMWSGPDRKVIYTGDTSPRFNLNGWMENPTWSIPGHSNWLILNPHWETKEAIDWYGTFHDPVWAMVETLEHVLRVQWYLTSLGIDYFMTTYLDIFALGEEIESHLNGRIPPYRVQYTKPIMENENVKALYRLVDFSKFLPVTGCFEWLRINHGENSFDDTHKREAVIHPNTLGHKIFANEVIIPFIDELYFS